MENNMTFILHLTEYQKGKEHHTRNLYFTKLENLVNYLVTVFPYALLSPPCSKSRYSDYYIRNSADEILFKFNITEPKFHDDVLEAVPKAWSQYGDHHITEIFPVEHATKLEAKFWEYFEEIGQDYQDSGRIGLVDDPESMDEYEELKSCCGSDDTLVEVEGVKYMFGCNFGH